MPHQSAPGLALRGIQTPAEPRLCSCGCGNSLDGRRADATAYSTSCRSRLARDRAKRQELVVQRCRCAPGALATVDPDGDLVCSKCGRFRTHVAPRIITFDASARAMVTDADGRPYRPARKRRPADWRVTRPDSLIVLHGSSIAVPVHGSPLTPFSTVLAA